MIAAKNALFALAVAGLLVATSLVTPAHAEDNWELLGSREVAFKDESDTIEVTAKEGRFVAIQFKVEDGNLEMYDIKVVFGNDESYSPEVKHEFKEGSRSRQIDLPGEARVIRKVEFWYKSRLREGKATVNLYGKGPGADKPGPDKPALPERDKRFPGFKHLASRTVDFGRDTDVMVIGDSHGAFKSLTIEVEDGELEMHDITITFGNGKQHSPEVKHEFKEGSRSRVIDLPGEARIVERITFKYRSSKLREGKAVVNVYGK